MILSNQQLDNSLRNFVNSVINIQPLLFPIYHTLYNTGMRVVECTELTRYHILTEQVIEFQPSKHNALRQINVEDVDPFIYNLILQGVSLYRPFSYPTMTYTFSMFFEFKSVTSGNKKVSTHLFRYNYIRKLMDSGYSKSEIGLRIGERDLSNLQTYMAQDLVAYL